jgi:hypothetical protein
MFSTRKIIATAALAITLMAAPLAANAASSDLPTVSHKLVTLSFINAHRTCVQEDSNNCGWDAHTNGNGVGCSFYASKRGTLYYTTKHCRNLMINALASESK